MQMPSFALALRKLEEGAGGVEAGGGVLDSEGEKVLFEDVEDVEDAEDVEDVEDAEDVEGGEDAEGVEDVKDEAMLLVREVEETDGVELEAPCIFRDSGEGA